MKSLVCIGLILSFLVSGLFMVGPDLAAVSLVLTSTYIFNRIGGLVYEIE
jgi:hypothetical protein